MGNIYVFDHPLIQHKIAMLRRKQTTAREFRDLAKEITMLMAYEATKNLRVKEIQVETPLCTTKAKALDGAEAAIVLILRAGLGMLDGMLELLPDAAVGHIGLARDPETKEPVEYYCKLPKEMPVRDIFVVDPMLATGGSAAAAVDIVKNSGAKRISFLCLMAAPEGIQALQTAHPDVDIYIAAKDRELNEHSYIIPGLGDAGDRLYATE